MVRGRQAEDPQPLQEAHPARVGGQLPNGHSGDDPVDPANSNDLPNGENKREEAEGIRKTSGDNNHPPPARPSRSKLRGSRQSRAERRAQA
ncbi:hypothetical protein TIFTF001_024067 [Ficus carica]|uniref:Uncharacterized protein n=1 Tax=Ficus carica TaxID=3494 RepID=A0AA88ALJ6_FICCA|nr:hypothetical protein TIFTF001_024067 [Ficus carica]